MRKCPVCSVPVGIRTLLGALLFQKGSVQVMCKTCGSKLTPIIESAKLAASLGVVALFFALIFEFDVQVFESEVLNFFIIIPINFIVLIGVFLFFVYLFYPLKDMSNQEKI